jgi:hypothetical protein
MGRYLAERRAQAPILWQAAQENALLSRGYAVLASPSAALAAAPTGTGADPHIPAPIVVTPSLTLATPQAGVQAGWAFTRECEYPSAYTVGQTLERPHASQGKVHGQFGCLSAGPWSPKAGSVTYDDLPLPRTDDLVLRLRYSKYSAPSVPILISLDDERLPRATLYPRDQGNWDQFAWSDTLALGAVAEGRHTLRFTTDGQQYGVADLDLFVLAAGAP